MLKKHFCIALIYLLSFGAVKAQSTDANMGIIPAPVSVTKGVGEFVLSQETVIAADSLDNKAVQFFISYLKDKEALRNPVKANNGNQGNNLIVLTSVGTDGLAPEGYRLTVTPQRITVAGKGTGLFYGIRSLMQLFPPEHGATIKLPCVEIEDYPRFGYRGLHLDVCRHFFGVEFVKKYIDLMASYKLNTFHWHLTDDQGWRIEIKKYPKLTQVGGMRAQTLLGSYRAKGAQYDGIPYSGFYTQDEIREVIKYAADRYITIIPEIEMPGHALAAIAAYPELSCDPERTYKVAETWGVFDDVFCPSEKTFSFLQDVLTEVIDLFPSKYIHIGGDECPKEAWKKSAFCQQLIKKLKLKDEHGLQSYFIQRMEKFVNAKGRSIIGWDEILEGGLAPNATVMSWRGEEGGIAAAKQNHNVIMTPSSNGLYFDHLQGPRNIEPLSIGGFAPYPKVYNYNPVPAVLSADQQKYILGVQANLWTEYIATEDKVEYMVLPRMMALAETAWSPLAKKDIKDFDLRLPKHFAWLDEHGYNYRVSKAIGAVDTLTIGSKLTVDLKPPVVGAKIYYTLDGYKPNENTLLYEHPFAVDIPEGESRELQTIVITPTGHQSLTSRTVMTNRPLMPAVTFEANTPGAKYKMVSGSFTEAAQLDDAPVIDSGVTKTFNTGSFRKNKAYGVIFSGYIRIDNDGKYLFSSRAGDGSVLMIDDQLILENSAKNADVRDGGEVLLKKGTHKFTLKYFNTTNRAAALHIYMQAPGKPKGELSAETIYN
ncbi:family 20 glycosylhydrolase [Mucilaginibacter myungsuensis]|uniref:beta-N-acetylhexosaminidase n=1 Tax=Mucilaginibacter myungsuensis TaxID=649104 RepID=A0A929KV08_9SPHI|nr:family 20 glycosylhydrolase [Mucilaginibacter myungsuensis]MBE9660955.1 family 20 glycosylhydrolase [Mucilaginibacter myungsuensis]MDN3601001.1 family 20 glycosylhydrolase [Mucilaginibacter myungsuensis]